MTQTLQHFQIATVTAAISALSKKSGPRRFLIADEVGLGKTVIAAAVVKELAKTAFRQGRPYCVAYFANSLQLLEQNRKRLKPAEGDVLFYENALETFDRLSLAWSWRPERKAGSLRLAVYTPGTTLPDLDASSFASGVRSERASVAAWASVVMGRALDRRIRRYLAGTWREVNVEDSRQRLLKFDQLVSRQKALILDDEKTHTNERRKMCAAFAKYLAHALELPGRPNGRKLRKRLGDSLDTCKNNNELKTLLARIRKMLRVALCEVTLARGHLKPDLIILDEFQRYDRLLDAVGVGGLATQLFAGTAVLMLSATPFARPRSDSAHHPLQRLAAFLYNDTSKAKAVGSAAAQYRDTILEKIPEKEAAREGWFKAVSTARDKLEEVLRPIIERTERWDDTLMMSPMIKRPRPMPTRDELLIFEDFGDRIRQAVPTKGPHQRSRTQIANIAASHAPSLWMSLPYPVQTLPAGYVASRALAASPKSAGQSGAPFLKRPADLRSPAAQPDTTDHPKLRAFLQEVAPARLLALPWMTPTLPWWSLRGAWSAVTLSDKAAKSLIFCHYRATPPAVGGLISRAVEREMGPQHIRWKDVPRKPRFAIGGSGASRDLKWLFFPWHVLAVEFDPIRYSNGNADTVLAAACSHLRLLMKQQFIGSCDKHEKFSDPIVCLKIMESERRGGFPNHASEVPDDVRRPRFRGKGFVPIARLALGGPGVILLRVLRRHFKEEADRELRAIEHLSWQQLRPYLGRRYFDRALASVRRRKRRGQSESDRERLLDATIDGNLEATLDEHIGFFRRLNPREADIKGVLDHLREVLSLTDGALALHTKIKRKRRVIGRLRAHVAVAYSGQEAARAARTSSALRPAQLQSAFNSPFWPHVLVSTSVGQEGLDFHVWCSRVVHWDCPPDPISLEQREGRVARFASAAVRRSLAYTFGESALARAAAAEQSISPWHFISEAANDENDVENSNLMGLRPWWVSKNGQYERVILAPNYSNEDERFDRIIEELDLYRLAIGQPDPKTFATRLHDRLSREEIRRIAIDLSGLRMRRQYATINSDTQPIK